MFVAFDVLADWEGNFPLVKLLVLSFPIRTVIIIVASPFVRVADNQVSSPKVG